MPIKVGSKTYKKFDAAVKAVKRSRPDVKDPKAYVAAVEETIAKRRAAKAKLK